MATTVKVNQPAILPLTGKSRFNAFQAFLPFSREKFRQLSRAGLAPRSERMGQRVTFYDNGELHRFLADPISYRVTNLAARTTQANADNSQKGGAK